ncbi:MAG: LPXTG cell wall anchor domain-containing protein [Acidobacteria bacterium]|nr:LPXTG cell wall anchor domain-containing protein [Acidobacteriota bacterium]
MTTFLMFLQETTQPKPDLTWNYVILGALVVIVLILGFIVVKRRKGRE